jgi:Rrf2 family protein
MLKLTRKADYGLIALRHLALSGPDAAASAKEIAAAYGMPVPLLAKVLQRLAKTGLLESLAGTHGGYRLTRHPATISALEVIRAIDGPVLLTSCFPREGACGQSPRCTVREPLRRVHEGIVGLLKAITIMELSEGKGKEANPAVSAGTPQVLSGNAIHENSDLSR